MPCEYQHGPVSTYIEQAIGPRLLISALHATWSGETDTPAITSYCQRRSHCRTLQQSTHHNLSSIPQVSQMTEVHGSTAEHPLDGSQLMQMFSGLNTTDELLYAGCQQHTCKGGPWLDNSGRFRRSLPSRACTVHNKLGTAIAKHLYLVCLVGRAAMAAVGLVVYAVNNDL